MKKQIMAQMIANNPPKNQKTKKKVKAKRTSRLNRMILLMQLYNK